MNVSLPAELENFVQNLVLTGSYPGPSEVVGEALQMLKRHEELRREIQVGIDELDRGEFVDGEEAFAYLMSKAKKLSETSSESDA
jgi:antitoxin ParD1/3/4